MNNYMKGDIYINKDYGTWFWDGDKVIYGTKNGEDLLVSAAYATLYAGGGDDKISLMSSSGNAVIYGEGGNDFIGTSMHGRNASLFGGVGNDTLRTTGSVKAYADGGEGDDLFIPLGDTKVTLTGGEGNDTFWFIESTTASISGGEGNNLYRFDPYYLFGPYHNDVIITDISSNDTIRYDEVESDTTELTWRKDGNNIVLTDSGYGVFNITLQGVSDIRQVADVTYRAFNDTKTLGEIFGVEPIDTQSGGEDAVSLNAAGTAVKLLDNYDEDIFDVADYGSKIRTVDGSAVTYGLEIIGNRLANSIAGGSGDDTFTGGNGADVFVYSGGKDVITDYGSNFDKITLAGDGAKYLSHITGVAVKNNNVTLTFSNNANKTLTLNNGVGKKVLINGAGRYFLDKQILSYDKTAVTLTSAYSGTFNGGSYKNINASAAQAVTIKGGNSSGVSIVGSSKADSITGTAGNDTLTGGYGADTFVYTGGKDTITDYAANFDKIQLNATGAKWLSNITGVRTSGSNVTLTFSNDSSKTLTLNGAKGKKVIVNGTALIFENGRMYNSTKTSSTVKSSAADVYWFDEHDFTSEPQLDAITKISASDYSVGKLDTAENLTKLTQDEFLLTFGDDK